MKVVIERWVDQALEKAPNWVLDLLYGAGLALGLPRLEEVITEPMSDGVTIVVTMSGCKIKVFTPPHYRLEVWSIPERLIIQ